MKFTLEEIGPLKNLPWISQRESEVLSFYLNNENSAIKKALLVEYLRYLKYKTLDGHVYNCIEHSGSFYNTLTDVVSLQTIDASKKAGQLFSNALLGTAAKGYSPFCVSGYLKIPSPTDVYNRDLIKEVTEGLSGIAHSFGIPVTGLEIDFTDKPEEQPFLALEVLAERIFPYDSVSVSAGCLNALVFLAGDPIRPSELSKDWMILKKRKQARRNNNNFCFTQKLLFECVKELVQIEGIGCHYPMRNLAGSLMQLARRRNLYVSLDITKVIENSDSFSEEEILLADTSGRMLIFCLPEKSDVVAEKLKKWGLAYSHAGNIYNDDFIQVRRNETVLSEISAKSLNEIASTYALNEDIQTYENLYQPEKEIFKLPNEPHPKDIANKLITLPQVASKKWLTEQFDSSVLNNNFNLNNETDARIVYSLTGNEPVAYAVGVPTISSSSDIYNSVLSCIMDLSRRIVCSGAEVERMTVSIAVTDNQCDKKSIEPISKACKAASIALQLKQFSGKSFGIEDNFGPMFQCTVPAFPIITMWGLVKKEANITGTAFLNKGDMIYLIGNNKVQFSGEYTKLITDKGIHQENKVDLEFEVKMQIILRELISRDLIKTAQSVGTGGAFTALVKSAIPNKFGFDITTDAEVRSDLFLFGEAPSRVLVSVDPLKEDRFIDFILDNEFMFTILGHITKEELRVDDISYGFIKDVRKSYQKSFSEYFK